MDSMELNKGVAALLVAGIVFMLSGILGSVLVRPHHLHESVLKIEAAAPATDTAKVEALTPIGPLLASADVANGEAVAKKQCAACHSFTEGGKHGVGPNLYEVVGRGHGVVAGFNSSEVLKSKAGPWSYEELNAWLKKPTAYAPGTKMAFAGISSDKQRADVIAYLRSLAKTPAPLPQ